MSAIDLNAINPYIISNAYINQKNCIGTGKSYGERLVKWYEMEYMLWGDGYVIVDGVRHKVTQGDLFFKQPGMLNEGIGSYHCYYLTFDLYYDPEKHNNYYQTNENQLENYIKTAPRLEEFPVVLNLKRHGRMEAIFTEIYREYIKNSPNSQFIMKSYVMEALRLAAEAAQSLNYLKSSSQSVLNNFPIVQELKSYILEHITQNFSLAQLAARAGLSKNFLCRIFTEISGETLIQFINRNKINHSKMLLIETRLTVTETAYASGFENASYYYTLFKRLEGVTPLEYRNRHRVIMAKQTFDVNDGISNCNIIKKYCKAS